MPALFQKPTKPAVRIPPQSKATQHAVATVSSRTGPFRAPRKSNSTAPELKDRIIRWEANGQHGIFAGARRYLRLLRSLVLNQIPYLHPAGRDRHASSDDIAAASLDTWAVLQRKWRTIPGGLDLITDEGRPLDLWRRVLKETHGIHLPERP